MGASSDPTIKITVARMPLGSKFFLPWPHLGRLCLVGFPVPSHNCPC